MFVASSFAHLCPTMQPVSLVVELHGWSSPAFFLVSPPDPLPAALHSPNFSPSLAGVILTLVSAQVTQCLLEASSSASLPAAFPPQVAQSAWHLHAGTVSSMDLTPSSPLHFADGAAW